MCYTAGMTGYPDHRRGDEEARHGTARFVWSVVVTCLLFVASGTEHAACATTHQHARGVVRSPVMTSVPGNWRQHGMASWYGTGGKMSRATASGETFDPDALTAAHPLLPLGTRLRVRSMRTGRSVVVRVNDRGPFHGHRIIDLSPEAARQLGMLGAGTSPVAIEPAQPEDEVASAPR